MLVVGLTASIACGKSTVSDYLISLGYKVVDSDKIVHRAYLGDNECYEKIVNYFDCVDELGHIDREKLASIIYSDSNKKRLLESIVHPYVVKVIKDEINKCNDNIIFLDIPLLYESHLEYICDKIVVVYVTNQIQLERLIKRNNINIEQANILISNQISIEKKKEMADYVIDNNNDLNELYLNINKFLKELNNEVL